MNLATLVDKIEHSFDANISAMQANADRCIVKTSGGDLHALIDDRWSLFTTDVHQWHVTRTRVVYEHGVLDLNLPPPSIMIWDFQRLPYVFKQAFLHAASHLRILWFTRGDTMRWQDGRIAPPATHLTNNDEEFTMPGPCLQQASPPYELEYEGGQMWLIHNT